MKPEPWISLNILVPFNAMKTALAIAVFLGCCLMAGSVHAAEASVAKAPGFFRSKKFNGRWWLLAPDGTRFISKGVTTVQFAQDNIQGMNMSPYGDANRAKYGAPQAWRKAAAQRLIGWGFNTLGAWSDEELSKITVDGKRLAYAPTIDLGGSFVALKTKGGQAWLQGVFPDVFDPDFEQHARQVAECRCAARKNDPWLLGWFTDNELRWGPDWRGKDELLTLFLNLPSATPGRQAAIALLRKRHAELSQFNRIWKTNFASWDEVAAAPQIKPPFTRAEVYAQNQEMERKANEADPHRTEFVADCDAFLAQLADHYFRTTTGAVKAADPNHMIFGCRFAYVPAAPVVAAAAKYLDVVSFNCYATDPRKVITAYSVFDKPLVIGEFSFRGEDSGLPNTRGAGPRVKTQAARATAFEHYVTWALSKPNLVGYHWFEHADEPKEGRFDGENSNYGVVNIQDEPYKELTSRMAAVNPKAESLHEGKGAH